MTRKIVLGITGASGAIYARALIDMLTIEREERDRTLTLAVVASQTAPEVWAHEMGGDLASFVHGHGIELFGGRDYSAPFASGSAKWDSMIIAPCSMSTLAKVAHGISDDLLTRAADVMLKERRALVLLARESPLSAIHLENMLAVTRAGAIVMPATPSFYGKPTTIDELVFGVVGRALDAVGIGHTRIKRWGDEARFEAAPVPARSKRGEE